ncbi:hypothetical protein COZ40_02535 [Candidatus Roizmanbacteria bacterium CG_4_10_14_3_um_filter_39_13]|uniref:DUF3048 domain-containing protein n=3 Tax=Candidatus Roizmaniibacteriota TaxID=1752723 RepID=A0A2M7EL55_9BACT|nr:MAG: hypothetical protein COS52_01650 [Candidatus Roizmanbacteria bacterium CG03_land_8_20_14_0_80_39_12]PIV71298.1 MAG: hypothetical protein COW57_00295 [Candidatus Roizmanbacteria bacterium CG17_big_fil_post_rev_8_21_14_2_50_39_7]PIX68576.1 MAG: hypothetical protein COZ40_02535 [Candidatus Roizmanbacteria bacterium CG_4_10_14_3_um_filter_39_13]
MDIKKTIAVAVLLFLASFGITYGSVQMMQNTKKAEIVKKTVLPAEEESSEPRTEECPINGRMMTKAQKDKWVTRRPLGVAIENHVDARPQSGLSSADVVYEAVAEGGITRFLAVYYCQDASFIGPIRSARVHFMTMLREYGEYPLYGHVGGANCDAESGSGCANGAKADSLGLIRKLQWDSYNDLNQFGVPFPYYWRDYDRLPNRATEHTVYSSTIKLWEYAKTKRLLTNVDEEGVSWDETFESWKFAADSEIADRGTINKIKLGFWNAFANDFSVVWNYSKEKNTYIRTNGGKPHMDKNTGKALDAKNIIIVFSKESPANDGYDGAHILYTLTGEGDALVFQNGKAIKATWQKEDPETRMKWYDEKGKEISIVRGKVFVEILPVGNTVTY